MAVLLFIDTICLALLTVGLTGGIWIAAQGKGGLLNRLFLRLANLGRSQQLFDEVALLNSALNRAYAEMKPIDEMQALRTKYEQADTKYRRYMLWRKPLLLCVRCMPSLWGTLLGVVMTLTVSLNPFSILLAIPMATIINSILFTYIKLD